MVKRLIFPCLMIIAIAWAPVVLCQQSDQKPPEKTAMPRRVLPRYWTQIGLTAEQKAKAYETIGSFETRINVLKGQIATLHTEEAKELAQLLTPAQRARLVEIVTNKANITNGDKPKTPDNNDNGSKP